MDKQYRVVFEECSGFHAGDLVEGAQVADSEYSLAYLVSVGAIEFVSQGSDAEKVAAAGAKVSKAAAGAKDEKVAADASAGEQVKQDAPATSETEKAGA